MFINDMYELWSRNTYFDVATRNELVAIANNEDEIYDRFYKDLEFGTAGIRGIIGAGTNRINKYVVRRVTYALAALIKESGGQSSKKSVVIGYDTRNFSLEFAKEAASVLASQDIRVFFSETVAPVPFVSYCTRALKCDYGIMITASHNPKEYNGYKVYGPDGAQIGADIAKKVTDNINKKSDWTQLSGFGFDFFRTTKERIKYIPKETIENYKNIVKNLTVDAKLVKDNAAKLKIVYTPLHGTGAIWVPGILKELGYKNLSVVEEQMVPDGNFSTVVVPNPEVRSVYDLGVKLAAEKGAGLILATDPDTDRLGCFVKDESGEYIMLNGNQIGCLLLDYILSSKKKLGTLPQKSFAVSTIVSTGLAEKICEAYGVNYTAVLTGFKYIGEQIYLREEKGDEKFQFGFEESFGYLEGIYARDKDAVASAVLLTEVACYYNTKGKNLLDAIEDIYAKYGYFADGQVSLELKGEVGFEKMGKLMEELRKRAFDAIEDKVIKLMDVKADTITNDKGEVAKTGLPSSNVLKYYFEDGWVAVRPSGTEPKVKFYFGFNDKDSMEKAAERVFDIKTKFINLAKEIIYA